MPRADLPRRALRAGPAPQPNAKPGKTGCYAAARSEIPHARHSPESSPSEEIGCDRAQPQEGRGHGRELGQRRGSGTPQRGWGPAGSGGGQSGTERPRAEPGAESWLPSQLCCCPRSGRVTRPPTCYIFRASTPEPRLLLTEPRASDTTLLQKQMSALPTKPCRFLRFS